MPLAKRRSEQENVFTTNNTRPNQKTKRLNQTALILTQCLTTAALQCTVRPLFFFFLTKSLPFNKKQPTGTINHDKQSKISQSIIRSKQNITNKHEKQSHQLTAKSITRTTTTNNPKSLNQNHAKTNTTSNYEKMQCF